MSAKVQNLNGQVFGRWTVIKRDETNSSNGRRICRCECGVIKSIALNNLKYGTSKGCKECANKDKITPMAGCKFGDWTVLSQSEKPISKTNGIYWNCKCKCGAIEIKLGHSLRVDKCSACRKCVQAKLNVKYPIGRYFTILKRRAKHDNIPFKLKAEYLRNLLTQQEDKCIYSGLPIIWLHGKGENNTASIDRIDSSKGYIEGNVQWVHKNVNMMKWSMTEKEFLDFCRLIARRYPV